VQVNVEWVPFGIGAALVVAGGIVIIFRNALFRAIAANQRAFFGKFGESVAKRGSARGLVSPGIFSMVLGAAMIALSIFR
jgi:hypothetical protein